MKSSEEIKAVFEANGADLSAPITTTCTSGVSACVLFAALKSIGHEKTAMFDGSWTEYSMRIKDREGKSA